MFRIFTQGGRLFSVKERFEKLRIWKTILQQTCVNCWVCNYENWFNVKYSHV